MTDRELELEVRRKLRIDRMTAWRGLVGLLEGDPAAHALATVIEGQRLHVLYRHPRWSEDTELQLEAIVADPGTVEVVLRHRRLPSPGVREAMYAFWTSALERLAGARPAQIRVTKHGPYRVEGEVALYDAEGELLQTDGCWHLCRCGGSRNKPYCDVTHGLKGFEGSEAASHDLVRQRRDAYAADDGTTIYDERSGCAHFGQCTTRLPQVFRAAEEPFVDPDAATGAEIRIVVRGCPSGSTPVSRNGSISA